MVEGVEIRQGNGTMTSNKAASAILIASGIAAMGLMAMHPTGDSSDMMIAGVHGSLMIVLLAQAASVFWTLGAGTLREMIATVFYAAGVIATMAAGTRPPRVIATTA